MIRFAVTRRALALLTLLGVGVAGAQQRRSRDSGYEARVDTTFAFDKSGSLTVNATNGDIVVVGWPRSEMKIRAVSDDDNIRFTGSSSRAILELVGPRRGSDARFEVSVPYGVRVTAQSQTGDISIRGTRGQVEAQSQSGDVTVDEVATRLDVTAFSGDVTASGINGDVTVNATSGDVRLTNVTGSVDGGTISADVALRYVTAKIVRVKTTSGEISFDGTIDPSGRYSFDTHSGEIGLRIPRDASAQLTVSTWTGAIDTDFPITLQSGQHSISIAKTKKYVFDIGRGSARITADTFSGDIAISSNGRGATQRP